MTDATRDSERDSEADTRTTGEHFLGPLTGEPPTAPSTAARRIADLVAQVDFLDTEVTRYRELVESERIRHAKAIADMALRTDLKADESSRSTRDQIRSLHDSFQSQLAQRQIEFDAALSDVAQHHADELDEERNRHQDIVLHERTRGEAKVEANRKQMIDELYESHYHSQQQLANELEQATATVTRLSQENALLSQRVKPTEATLKEQALEARTLRRRIDVLEENARAHAHEIAELTKATGERLEAERSRSAATLTELLERSATVAADADKARAQHAEQKATAEHAAAVAIQRAQAEYDALKEAADDRVFRALERESELEASIVTLQAQLGDR